MMAGWPLRPCAHSLNSPMAKGSRLPHTPHRWSNTLCCSNVSVSDFSFPYVPVWGRCLIIFSRLQCLKVPFKSSQEHVSIRMSAAEPNAQAAAATPGQVISTLSPFPCDCDKYHDREQPGQEGALPGHSPSLRDVRPGTHAEPGAETTEGYCL